MREALDLGRQFGFPVRVVNTAEFQNDRYLANPTNRCYFCKHALFTELTPLARAEGLAVIVYGENASDLGDHRPGAQAAGEFQVRAPLKEAGLTKTDIRTLSARLGLPTADKPQLACLSSRIPTGEAVTSEKLRMVEEAECFLRDLGFFDVRVRHHEIGHQPRAPGDQAALPIRHLARIEIGTDELPRLVASEAYQQISAHCRRLGYAFVTLDLDGYRRGSTNGAIEAGAMSFESSIRFKHTAIA